MADEQKVGRSAENVKRFALVAVLVLFVAACAPQPILYPNAYYKEVGKDIAHRDIEECRSMAKDAGATPTQGKTGQVAGSTAGGGRLDPQVEQWGERLSGARDVARW